MTILNAMNIIHSQSFQVLLFHIHLFLLCLFHNVMLLFPFLTVLLKYN